MPWISLLLFSRAFDYSAFSSACSPDFAGIDEAAPFDEGIGVHPVVLLSEGKGHSWNASLPSSWQPNSVSDTQLIACIGEEASKRIQTCTYIPSGTFIRYRYSTEVRLFSAYRGDLIHTITVYGSDPRNCPSIITVPPYTHTAYGSHVSSEDLRNSLRDYVNGFVVRRFVAPSNQMNDLAFDGTNLWAADDLSDKILKLDPTTGEVLSSFDFEYPNGLTFDGTHLWVTSASPRAIFRLDATTGEVLGSFDTVTNRIVGLAYNGEYLWGCELYGDILKLDSNTGAVVSSFDSPAAWPWGLAFDGTHLWLADNLNDKIYKLDPATGEVLSSFDSPVEDPDGLAFDGTHLWIVGGRWSGTDTIQFIYKVNPP